MTTRVGPWTEGGPVLPAHLDFFVMPPKLNQDEHIGGVRGLPVSTAQYVREAGFVRIF